MRADVAGFSPPTDEHGYSVSYVEWRLHIGAPVSEEEAAAQLEVNKAFEAFHAMSDHDESEARRALWEAERKREALSRVAFHERDVRVRAELGVPHSEEEHRLREEAWALNDTHAMPWTSEELQRSNTLSSHRRMARKGAFANAGVADPLRRAVGTRTR